MSRAKRTRTLKKLEKLFKANEFYEAEQMLKTFHKRLNAQKKYDQSAELLTQGAKKLFSAGKGQAACSVCSDLIDTWKEGNVAPTQEHVDTIIELFNLITPDTPKGIKCKVFKNSQKWIEASEVSNKDALVRDLNACAARNYADRSEFAESSKFHLRCGGLTDSHCDLIRAWSVNSGQIEKDYFVARIILQYLCMGNVRDAFKVMENFEWQQMGGGSPVANFIVFFLFAVGKKYEETYHKLIEIYQPVIKQDSDFEGWLQIIGQIHFNIQPPQKNNGLLGNLMNMMNN